MEIALLVVIVFFYLISSIKILAEYERGVIFRLGRVLPGPKGPGVCLVFKPIDRMVRLSLRLETTEVPAQDIVTKDNVDSLVQRETDPAAETKWYADYIAKNFKDLDTLAKPLPKTHP